MSAQVVSSAGSGLEGCVAALGANPSDVGIEAASVAQGKTIPLARFAARLERAARLTRRPDLGLLFAQGFDMRAFGALGQLMHRSATIRDSLEAYVANYSKIQSDTDVALDVSGNTASVFYSVRDASIFDGSQDAEFSTGIILRFVSNACGSEWGDGALRFAHPPQEGRAKLAGGCRVPFGILPTFNAAANSVLFPAKHLEHRNPMADAELADILQAHLRSQPSVDGGADDAIHVLKQVVDAEIRSGRGVTVEKVARRIGMSSRHLQRLCASHGVSFRELRNEAVVAVASEWLRHEKRSITEVALRLGFSETSSFSRAFRIQTGSSPRQLKGG